MGWDSILVLLRLAVELYALRDRPFFFERTGDALRDWSSSSCFSSWSLFRSRERDRRRRPRDRDLPRDALRDRGRAFFVVSSVFADRRAAASSFPAASPRRSAANARFVSCISRERDLRGSSFFFFSAELL